MPDVLTANHEDDILCNVGSVIRDAFQIS